MDELAQRLRLAADLHLMFSKENYEEAVRMLEAENDPADLVLALLALGKEISRLIDPEVYEQFLARMGTGAAVH